MGRETAAGNAFAHVLINEALIGHGVRGQRSSRGCGLRFSDGKQEAWNQRKAGILRPLAGLSRGARWAGGKAGFGDNSLRLPVFPQHSLREERAELQEHRGLSRFSRGLPRFPGKSREVGRDTHPGGSRVPQLARN